MSTEKRPKTIAILQSNYIPWKGYFDIIASADEFLIFDDVQFTRRDWRNRNRIIQNGRPMWLTIPVASKGAYEGSINTIEIADRSWARKHWASIQHAYSKAPYFRELAPTIEATYELASAMSLLTEINELFLKTLSEALGLRTAFLRTEHIPRTADNPTARLVEICLAREASVYVSGPSAKAYIDRAQFESAGVALAYANYQGYPIYDQGIEPFEHGVSMLDVMFRFGPEAHQHLKTQNGFDPFLDFVE